MNERLKIKVLDIDSIPSGLLDSRWPRSRWIDLELENYVNSIIEEVKRRGDMALIRFTRQFDDVELSPDTLKVRKEEIDVAYSKVKEKQLSALKFLKNQVEYIEGQLLERMNFESEKTGIKIYFKTCPIESVGCYVPGGEAAYPSTLIMTATPARLAGVRRIVVCSPPTKRGMLNPLTLVAADLCGISELYKVGGAQAIAALAYGTDSIRPVEKIVGPGNRYVTMAKILVSRDVATDFPAGPTEILILADESADPRLIALDLISQAEHRVDSISILITTSEKIAERVVEEIDNLLSSLPRKEIVAKALAENGLIIRCENLDEAVDFTNDFAPEHLEIITRDPMAVADKITSAGLILTGPYAPVSASDYAFGTNHILPTGGFGHAFSGLSVLDFVRRVSIVESTKYGLSTIRNHIGVLAEAEGLMNHALAVDGRFQT
ncbi:MAG: histidinol dehydrogenase [Candidatus Bathyarchaeia archaeon]